jgi:DNA-binding transcriptional ArsR family regulator
MGVGSVSRIREPEVRSAHEQRRLVAKALADPVRSRVLNVVADAGHEAGSNAADPGGCEGVTVRQISERIREPRRKVRYHLDALCADGIVEVSCKHRCRGVIERYFVPARLPILLDEEVEDIPQSQQQMMLLNCVKSIFADVTASLSSGVSVRRPEWAAGRVVGELDEQGWRELAQRHAELSLEANELIARSRERMRKSGESPIRVVSVNLFLETLPRDASSGPPG